MERINLLGLCLLLSALSVVGQEASDSKPALESTAAGDKESQVRTIKHSARFAFEVDTLNRFEAEYLTKLINFVKQKRIESIQVVGYAQKIGMLAYNQRLSKQRAHFIAAFLKERGLDEKLIKIRWEVLENTDLPLFLKESAEVIVVIRE